jgi:DNA (cytosine-5)-methyltransferase 1
MPINIVDLFAGPGGLGEGFSSTNNGEAFKILVSAEMETSAHKTLCLRSYYRLAKRVPDALKQYYDYCKGVATLPYDESSRAIWKEAEKEARQLELGKPEDNRILDQILNSTHLDKDSWVLIGGPPCQAYSLVGRARNAGTKTYKAEKDPRHFLYKEYLRIIRDRRPPVFVMENVKGILSSKIKGKKIFHEILGDLADPDRALGMPTENLGYKIHSLVTSTYFEKGMEVSSVDPRDFIVRSEEFGIPQARHRVILLGIRTDIVSKFRRLAPKPRVTVWQVLHDLPRLRSSVSKTKASDEQWKEIVSEEFNALADDAESKEMHPIANALRANASMLQNNLTPGGLRVQHQTILRPHSADWYVDPNLLTLLNHEARAHMRSDLRRYAFASTLAQMNNRSPKGHLEFMLSGLAPKHSNWESGKFVDRFRVQCRHLPGTTVTSHIAKDGHYFIHPDPTQCRSLTVREAARLQTFPDNYFFQGNRTEQFHQVGNAVPPMLANQIAEVVLQILSKHARLKLRRQREQNRRAQVNLSTRVYI